VTGTFPSPPEPDLSGWRRRRHRRPGAEHSAGHVLVVMVVGLLLAALVNSDALVERAERKPFGSGRDRSLAIWHPVQDVAHVLQLHRLRALGDDVVGDEDEPDDGELVGPDAPVTTTTLPPAEDLPPELRAPTAAAPLRVYIGGDSIVRDAGESFLRIAAEDPLLSTTMHYEIATGLTRPDFYDWPAALVADAEALGPEVMFIMFGGNDAQGIVGPDGTVHDTVDSPGWRAEYGRRVEIVMDSLRADGRLILWIGMPPVRSPGFQGRVDVLNEIYETAAEGRPWVRFVDLSTVLGDADGRYVERLPEVDGALRQSDGIHLARPGADHQARFMLTVLREALAELAPATTTTSAPTTTAAP
jgi:hypothetical protein